MATSAMGISPPPGPGTQSGNPAAPPTQPTAVSPAPATPSGGDALSSQVIAIVQQLRTLGQAAPQAAAAVREINDIIQGKLMPALMQNQPPGEPQAPPT